ncbi:50S ribosomal protein L9 [Azotobacter sp. CWF10]
MQLILLQKVTNLGNLGDLVDVKPGYGRNFLVPQGKAVPATEQQGRVRSQARRIRSQGPVPSHAEADARKAKLDGASVTIPANAPTEGKLYGSVGAARNRRCLHRCRPAGQQERSHPG